MATAVPPPTQQDCPSAPLSTVSTVPHSLSRRPSRRNSMAALGFRTLTKCFRREITWVRNGYEIQKNPHLSHRRPRAASPVHFGNIIPASDLTSLFMNILCGLCGEHLFSISSCSHKFSILGGEPRNPHLSAWIVRRSRSGGPSQRNYKAQLVFRMCWTSNRCRNNPEYPGIISKKLASSH